jgi:hypothetical protein
VSRHQAFVDAARTATALVLDPRVEQRWRDPSALAEMSIGALTSHLVAQVVSVAAGVLDPSAASSQQPVGLLDHYERAAWVGATLDDEANVSIRERAERTAADGYAGTRARLERACHQLDPWPSKTPSMLRLPWWDWSLTLDDFLLTRMMELVVHADDLAVSLGVPTPEFPRSVTRPVFMLLTALAERKHGQTAVVRALTRAERAPASLAVF